MDRRLSRTAMPAVAATILAALFAQPILAAKPTVTTTHVEGPSADYAADAQSACGVTGVSAYLILDSRLTAYPAGTGNGLVSTRHTRQRITFTVAATGASAHVAQAATLKTYSRGGHTYTEFSGRNLQVGLNGHQTTRDGVVTSRTGKAISLGTEICRALTAGPGARANAAATGAPHGSNGRSAGAERGRSAAEADRSRSR